MFIEKLELPVDNWIEAAVNWLITNYRFVFQKIKVPIELTLNNIEALLQWLPPIVVILIFAGLGFWAAGRKTCIFAFLGLLGIGVMGVWEEAMTTLSMVLSSVIFCIIVGIPVGIIGSQSDRFYSSIRPLLDAMQSTPAFVYLVPVVMLFSIGTVAGVIATIVFSIPPVIRLTNLGLRQVHPELIEAGKAFGATRWQILRKIQIPNALPTIMAGLNQNIMLALAMVVIASLIGAGGLGLLVFEGVNSLKIGLAGIGGASIVLIAMVLDRITQALGQIKKE
jgi:glycine betaine/proline transport system permease protein